MRTFTAQVEAWVQKSEAASRAVFKEAAELVIDAMQKPVGEGGNMPIRTGFLRRSLLVTTSLTAPRPGAYYNEGAVSLAIAQADDVIYAIYTANYARHVNYGARGRPARLFRELAVQRWQEFVNQATAKVRARVG